MSASGGNRAIIAAFLANMGIALSKFAAWFFSGSSSSTTEFLGLLMRLTELNRELPKSSSPRTRASERGKGHVFLALENVS